MAGHRHHVLVVEDDQEVRAMIATALEGKCDVSTASDGAEALRLARNRPCVILLDLMMPAMNGWEFLEQARVRVPSIPIIAVTAYGSSEGVRSLGVADYLRKPFRVGVLQELLTKHCREGAPTILTSTSQPVPYLQASKT